MSKVKSLSTASATVWIEKHKSPKLSAVVVADSFVISHGSLLKHLPAKLLTRITDCLLNERSTGKNFLAAFDELEFCVARASQPLTRRTTTNFLIQSNIKLGFIFRSQAVSNALNDVLKGFQPEDKQSHSLKILNSTFLVFNVNKFRRQSPMELVEFMLATGHDKVTISKQEEILAVSTPFGNECFFGTINSTNISNIFGTGGCLFTIDKQLASGSEGGGVFNRRLQLVGIIIGTTIEMKEQLLSISLVANLPYLIRELNSNYGSKLNYVQQKGHIDNLEKTVVLLECDSLWGTGCFVHILTDLYAILTCSHVVQNENRIITCFSAFGKFTTEIISRNRKIPSPFDIALLRAPNHIPKNAFACLEKTKPLKGDIIKSVGFPIFSGLAKNSNFTPSILKGSVTNYESGVLYTDASIQNGQSGSPIFNNTGRVIGISVSNICDHETNIIYPTINMAVPICDIYDSLARYGKSKDTGHIQLESCRSEVVRQWNLQPQKLHLSKL